MKWRIGNQNWSLTAIPSWSMDKQYWQIPAIWCPFFSKQHGCFSIFVTDWSHLFPQTIQIGSRLRSIRWTMFGIETISLDFSWTNIGSTFFFSISDNLIGMFESLKWNESSLCEHVAAPTLKTWHCCRFNSEKSWKNRSVWLQRAGSVVFDYGTECKFGAFD